MNKPAPLGLLKALNLRVFDPDALSEAVSSSEFEHLQLEPGRFTGDLKHLNLGRLAVDSGHYTRKVIARGSFPADRVIVGCVLDCREEGIINGYRFGRQDVVVFPEGSELDYVMPADTVWCSVQFPRSILERAGFTETELKATTVIAGNRRENARLAGFLRTLLQYRGQSERDVSPLSELSAALIEERLLGRIRCAVESQETASGHARRQSWSSRMAILRRFEQRLRDDLGEVLHIPDLCTELGTSQRTLEVLFKQELGMTPKQFTDVVRLNAVRLELTHPPADQQTVADIAQRYGIHHLGRFAANYRRHFGEFPSETLGGR
jgi:AraC family ethanolamine operon transcriptional activator